MKKRMRIMLIFVGILFGGIFIWKAFTAYMLRRYLLAHQTPIVTVSALPAGTSFWQPMLQAIGSLRAIKGVNVTTQLAGMVDTINFTPGATVKEGEKLVQLIVDTDVAQLQALIANAELALLTYNRDKAQYAVNAVSKQTVDTDLQNLRNLRAQVKAQQTIVEKKSIVAPFSGRLGINYVNPGQFLNPGDRVVNLQTLDPIYVDFYLPQQSVAELKVGQKIEVTVDAFPNEKFQGEVTTLNPAVDVNTRNIQAEGTLQNPDLKLLPGMFVHANILVGEPVKYITVPQTAVTFNPYGQLIYTLHDEDKKNKTEHDGAKVLIAKQNFVTTGDQRGNQIAILKGLKEGELVVVAGQLKLKNNSRVQINNSVLPFNNPDPITPDEH